ncbi:MAG TPA: putative glycoside hydrolase [Aquabacterium sp.]|nr:putative glycoside hydrolase [Aquabacterium sp.]
MISPRTAAVWLLGSVCLTWWSAALALDGQVVDAITRKPVARATVVVEGRSVSTDEQGRFRLDVSSEATPSSTSVGARACGYARVNTSIPSRSQEPVTLALHPFQPKTLYLSVFGIGSSTLREAALKVIADTELNGLVIDVKDDRGLVPYRSASVAASGLGPQKPITVSDMPALIKRLKALGLHLIARVAVFKDDQWATAHPQWAVHRADGSLWRDGEDIAWIDAFQRPAWERSLAIAEEAAQLGFDEVQFDYVRFPDAKGLVFSDTNTEAKRVATITAFVDAARQRLAKYNVFVAADIFGYVAWNTNDTDIGQQLEALAPHAEVLSPMLYPSGFTFGIPDHRDPVADAYDIVEHTLRRAQQRANGTGVCWRPWLQAFKDYAFDRRVFGANEIRRQIDAAESTGTTGWMIWNPRNHYTEEGLKLKASESPSP